VLLVYLKIAHEVMSFQAIFIVDYGWSKKTGPAMLV